MKAEPSEQHQLITLADIDTGLAQADHRRSHLPEQAELDAAEQEVATRSVAVQEAERTVAELSAQQEAADAEVEAVRSRIERNRALMDTVRVAKELEGLQHEMNSLRERQTQLEDAELEVMEQVEEAEAVLAGARKSLASGAQTRDEVLSRRDEALQSVAEEEASLRARRGEVGATVSAELLSEYERVRVRVGDPGAAMLRRGRCEGCHLELAATALNDLRHLPADQLAYCEECERILVRDETSGL
jgi:hypothetical protein